MKGSRAQTVGILFAILIVFGLVMILVITGQDQGLLQLQNAKP